MKAKLLLALLPAASLCWPAMSIHAQISQSEAASAQSQSGENSPHATGRIAGVLKDPSGAVVQGANILVRNLATGMSESRVTDQLGRFAFDGLFVGRYQVTATAAGFSNAVIDDLSVAAGKETNADVSLVVAGAQAVVEVTSAVEAGEEAIASKKTGTSDAASLFRDAPGLSLAANGGLSSLPAIHGLFDDRVKVLVNGMTLAEHCSNHMNPPMSYIDPGNVGRVNAIAGITPVSNGGDSIGGTIMVDSAEPEFAAPGQRMLAQGSLTAYHRTNGVVSGGDASFTAATEHLSAMYTGTYVNAADYKNGAAIRVISTLFESRTYNLQLAARRGSHLFTAGIGYQDIPEEGFPNAHMDMLKNESRYANLRYRGNFPWGKVDARAFYARTGHEMNILSEKQLIMNMNMPMDTRGANLGYTLETDVSLSGRDVLRVGTDYHRFTLDDWWPAAMTMVGSMGPNTLWNIHDGSRDRFGAFAEWEGRHGNGWTELVGVRGDLVMMNTGAVEGYNMCGGQMNAPSYCMMKTQTGSAAYYDDATAFNSTSHGRRDNNFDLTALGRYVANVKSAFEFGYARKTRSPNLYERYLWVKQSAMSVDMNGWFGDLNGYSGNLNLLPEIANTVSGSIDFHDSSKGLWQLKVTPYFTRVQNYIDVARCPVSLNGNGNGCTASRFNATSATIATTPYVTLLFGNYGAQLVGVDGSGRLPLGRASRAGEFSLSGLLGYIHGIDTALQAPGSPGQQPLYNMMPLNARVTLGHNLGNWSSSFDLQAVDAKKDLQAVRMELHTPGYVLANLRTSYQRKIAEPLNLRFDAGIDNLAARSYVLPLGGRYYGPTMMAIKAGASVPGMGRNFHGGLTFEF
jgi:iron complex outermembrane receptor protein